MVPERNIRNTLKENREKEYKDKIVELERQLQDEGYIIHYGSIGQKTTYCMLTRDDNDEEIVGYTFIRDVRYKNEVLGKLKALQQVVARRDMMQENTQE